jgi:hypothetical protein
MTRITKTEYQNLLKRNPDLVRRTKHSFWRVQTFGASNYIGSGVKTASRGWQKRYSSF